MMFICIFFILKASVIRKDTTTELRTHRLPVQILYFIVIIELIIDTIIFQATGVIVVHTIEHKIVPFMIQRRSGNAEGKVSCCDDN